MARLEQGGINHPTSLLHLTYLLQQNADELLDNSLGAGLGAVRIMSVLHTNVTRSQQEIAATLRQTESNVSRQLKTMKKLGLVNIVKNKKDGRQRDVKLTSKGSNTYKRAQKLLDAQQKRWQTAFRKNEKKSLDDSIEKLLKAI